MVTKCASPRIAARLASYLIHSFATVPATALADAPATALDYPRLSYNGGPHHSLSVAFSTSTIKAAKSSLLEDKMVEYFQTTDNGRFYKLPAPATPIRGPTAFQRECCERVLILCLIRMCVHACVRAKVGTAHVCVCICVCVCVSE